MEPNPYASPSTSQPPVVAASAAARPLGVKILTIWLGLFAGVVPIVAVLFAYQQPEVRRLLELTPLLVALSVTLGAAIIVAAIAAWRGSNTGRYALLSLSVVHYGLVAWNNFNFATSQDLPVNSAQAWARVVRSLITIGILVWYFALSSRPEVFYRRDRAAP